MLKGMRHRSVQMTVHPFPHEISWHAPLANKHANVDVPCLRGRAHANKPGSSTGMRPQNVTGLVFSKRPCAWIEGSGIKGHGQRSWIKTGINEYRSRLGSVTWTKDVDQQTRDQGHRT
ncbi:hypothetical protein DUNSADRAFT_5732 [Dunaliella salina]|uniref:Encoded protein n=1 Tax=Dunaliella salina TaxID=3046 RepID=A0ABQ7GPP5_DUNSA|nr:hypothetical protein DUNSADRAFT_5732 [Dunaliella salina]|eukprot:KAF5836579.1 hypothetical protein DUNSADRAFT_5732 [Dunaliella salina]